MWFELTTSYTLTQKIPRCTSTLFSMQFTNRITCIHTYIDSILGVVIDSSSVYFSLLQKTLPGVGLYGCTNLHTTQQWCIDTIICTKAAKHTYKLYGRTNMHCSRLSILYTPIKIRSIVNTREWRSQQTVYSWQLLSPLFRGLIQALITVTSPIKGNVAVCI